MKKIGIFLLTLISVFTLVACKVEEEVPEGDTTPPVFIDAISGKLTEVTHLQGDVVDLMDGIKIMDDITLDADIVLTLDKKDYDLNKPGTYVVTYSAKDEAGNESKVDRTVVVYEAVEAEFPAIVIGETYIKYNLNDETSFENIGGNSKFRLTSEEVSVMDKDFYISQLEAHKDAWESNNGLPSFAWGVVVVVDEAGKVVHARYTQGAQMEMNSEGELKWAQEELPWFHSSGGGNLLVDLVDNIPENGKVILGASNTAPAPDLARIFLINNTFWTGYVGGGGVVKDVQDVDVTDVTFEFVEDFNVKVKKPAAITTPVIEVNRHVLTWDKVENARGYNLYINGVLFNKEELLQANPINLLDLEELEIGKKYEFTLEAISMDFLKWSDSLISETFEYDRIEILTQVDPVITYNETNKNIEWTKPEGSNYMEVYVEIHGRIFLVDTTEDTSFNPHSLEKDFSGKSLFFIKSVGLDTHSDSTSNKVEVTVERSEKVMTVGSHTFKVQIMSPENYYARRNGNLDVDYIYLIEDVKNYTFVAGDAEANNVVMVLDKDFNVKLVRNIVGNHAWVKGEGWVTDAAHSSGAQLTGIQGYMEDGDFLLVGRNTGVSVQDGEVVINAIGRDVLSYHFIKKGATIPTQSWRDSVDTFMDPSKVEFTIK